MLSAIIYSDTRRFLYLRFLRGYAGNIHAGDTICLYAAGYDDLVLAANIAYLVKKNEVTETTGGIKNAR